MDFSEDGKCQRYASGRVILVALLWELMGKGMNLEFPKKMALLGVDWSGESTWPVCGSQIAGTFCLGEGDGSKFRELDMSLLWERGNVLNSSHHYESCLRS